MTNAKKSKQQRSAGTRPASQQRAGGSQRKAPPPRSKGGKGSKGGGGRRRSGSSRGLWIALGVGLVALVLLALAFTGDSGSPSPEGSVTIAGEPRTESIPVGAAIPEWSAPSLDGAGDIAWSDYVGAPTVFAIWAPWCQHCQAELPRLAAAVEARAGIQLVTVTTALDRGGPSPQEYMDSRDLSFPVGVDDAAGTISSGVGVAAFPTTYYVDSNGNVVTFTEGEVDEAQLSSILDELATT